MNAVLIRRSHDNADGLDVGVDDEVVVVHIVVGPNVVVVVRRVRVDVREQLRRSGQDFEKVGQKSGVVFLQTEIFVKKKFFTQIDCERTKESTT